MLVFVEGGKPENPEKNPRSKAKTNGRLKPHIAARAGIKLERRSLLKNYTSAMNRKIVRVKTTIKL